jgi:glucose uptake protein
MVIVTSYAVAIFLCFVTMLCWGSWANTQKLAGKEWRFQLYYWDYAMGVLLLAFVLAVTMGNLGTVGRGFYSDLSQASGSSLGLAFLGGVIFNLSNILLVAAIDIAGMAVAFPIGVGLALVLGVATNYLATPIGNPVILFFGVAFVVIAIIVDALAYRRLMSRDIAAPSRGILISVVAGLLMGFFYRFVAASMASDFANPEPGKLTPYTAVVLFSIGLFVSNLLWNSIAMARPFVGDPVPASDYFRNGNLRLHSIGVLGGVIWSMGMAFSIIASGAAGFAVSYGLGQGATMIAALWGVFIWREFKGAPAGTGRLLVSMFVCYAVGLAMIIASRIS